MQRKATIAIMNENMTPPSQFRTSKKRSNTGAPSEAEDSFTGFQLFAEVAADIMKKAVEPILSLIEAMSKRLDTYRDDLQEIKTKASNPITLPEIKVMSEPTPPTSTQIVRRLAMPNLAKVGALSYAQAAANSPLPPTNIRNINIMGTPQEVQKKFAMLRKDNLFSDVPLKSVRAKGEANLTFKCADQASGQAMSDRIVEKYGPSVIVKQVEG